MRLQELLSRETREKLRVSKLRLMMVMVVMMMMVMVVMVSMMMMMRRKHWVKSKLIQMPFYFNDFYDYDGDYNIL